MIEQILNAVEHIVIRYGSLGVFTGVLCEEIISVFPSVAVATFAGFVFLTGQPVSVASFGILLYKIALPAALGLTIGSLFLYSIVYAFGKPFIDRFGKYVRISWQDISRAQAFMGKHERYEMIAFFFLRAIPLIPFSVMNVFCGLVRWPPVSFIAISFFGAIIRTGIFAFVGWQLGRVYRVHLLLFQKFENYVVLALGIAFVLFLLRRRYVGRGRAELAEKGLL